MQATIIPSTAAWERQLDRDSDVIHIGFRPEQDQTVKVWFGRRGHGFEVRRFEPVENAVPEESSEDES